MTSPEVVPSSRSGAAPSAISVNARHIWSGDIVSREIAGEVIVVPIRRDVGDLDSVYTFNSLGKQLWSLLEQARTPAELANWVSTKFDVAPDTALADVVDFLGDLKGRGLTRLV